MQSTELETWNPVVGYAGLYEVSDQGRVRSLPRRGSGNRANRVYGGSVLRPGRFTSSGHLSVALSRDNRASSHSVHVLVLAAFVGPCPDGQEVRHMNDDPSDNRLANLEYGTRRENMLDRARNGKSFMANKTHCPHGHEYASWNLDAYTLSIGRRRCLACTRARRWGGKRGLPFDPKKADEIYAGLAAR